MNEPDLKQVLGFHRDLLNQCIQRIILLEQFVRSVQLATESYGVEKENALNPLFGKVDGTRISSASNVEGQSHLQGSSDA